LTYSATKGIDWPSQLHKAPIERAVRREILVRDGEELAQDKVEVTKLSGTRTKLEAGRNPTSIDLYGVRPSVLKAGAQLDLDQSAVIAVDEVKRPVAVGFRFRD